MGHVFHGVVYLLDDPLTDRVDLLLRQGGIDGAGRNSTSDICSECACLEADKSVIRLHHRFCARGVDGTAAAITTGFS